MLVNCTPHALNVQRVDGTTLDIPPSGRIARCSQTTLVCETVDGIAIAVQTFGDVQGLPSPVEGTRYVVSRIVAEACRSRHDLLIPGPLLRDEQGRVTGCDGLSVLPVKEDQLTVSLAADVAAAAEFSRRTGGDMSDASWHLAGCLLALKRLGVEVPALLVQREIPTFPPVEA